MTRCRLWLLFALLLPGCGAPPGPLATHPPAGDEPTPVVETAELRHQADSPAPPPTPQTDTTVRFEPAPAKPPPGRMPHVEIKFPTFEQRIIAPKASRYRVRLKVDPWPLGNGGAAVQVSLDDHPPRLVTNLKSTIRLGELVSEDRELGPGAHRLFAVAVRGSGEMIKPAGPVSRGPFATVRFHVGARGQPAPEGPMLVYSRPRGTINGPAAANAVLLDYFVLNAEVGENGYGIEVTVTGRERTWATRVRRWQPLLIRGLPSGDYEVALQLLDRNGQPVTSPGARVARAITVNRDAPVPTEGAAGTTP